MVDKSILPRAAPPKIQLQQQQQDSLFWHIYKDTNMISTSTLYSELSNKMCMTEV